MSIKLGNIDVSYIKVGGDDCSIYLGDTLLYSGGTTPPTPPSFDGKWLATYEGGSTDSAACDSSSAISRSEIDTYDLIDLQIGDCVTSIGNYGIYNAYYLTSVTIGTGLTSIGESAFDSCSSLQDLTINTTAPPSLGRKAFQSCSNLSNIYVPSESVSDYQSASGWSSYASIIQAIPNS